MSEKEKRPLSSVVSDFFLPPLVDVIPRVRNLNLSGPEFTSRHAKTYRFPLSTIEIFGVSEVHILLRYGVKSFLETFIMRFGHGSRDLTNLGPCISHELFITDCNYNVGVDL